MGFTRQAHVDFSRERDVGVWKILVVKKLGLAKTEAKFGAAKNCRSSDLLTGRGIVFTCLLGMRQTYDATVC